MSRFVSLGGAGRYWMVLGGAEVLGVVTVKDLDYILIVYDDILYVHHFKVWLPVTSHDLWLPSVSVGIFNIMWGMCMHSIRSIKVTLLELSYLQGFLRLTCGSLTWPLTSAKITVLLEQSLWNIYMPSEISLNRFASRTIMLKSISQFDLRLLQMTFNPYKNDTDLTFNDGGHLHVWGLSLLSLFIAFTSSSRFAFLWPQMIFDLHENWRLF